ncbi:MAG: hypothetical protein QTN59_11795 [Candidatus Electrothrix communis]|nr:MAG: hypothetical protein QTN59_11795 [Candidatus Electrothrix communis]
MNERVSMSAYVAKGLGVRGWQELPERRYDRTETEKEGFAS